MGVIGTILLGTAKLGIKAGLWGMGVAGKAGLGLAYGGAKLGTALATKAVVPAAIDAGKIGLGLANKTVSGMFSFEDGLKLTNKGKAMMTGGAALIGLYNGGRKYIEAPAMNIAGVASLTPNWEQKYKDRQQEQGEANPGYIFNGGATGDLVFALNALRNNG